MINIESFKRVLKLVEETPKRKSTLSKPQFEYTKWFRDLNGEHKTVADVIKHPCGTAGCLGGWGAVFQMDAMGNGQCLLRDIAEFNDTVWSSAQTFYGIDSFESIYLFYGHWHPDAVHAPTEDVIKKLKNIIETNKVVNYDFDERFKTQS